MTHTIKQSAKGWIITVGNKRNKHVYFLYDDKHIKGRYIPHILANENYYDVGKPFGQYEDINPIYLRKGAIEAIEEELSPYGVFSKQFKMNTIWMYYRSFVNGDDAKVSHIKAKAKELKSLLNELGLNGLYRYVIEQTQQPVI